MASPGTGTVPVISVHFHSVQNQSLPNAISRTFAPLVFHSHTVATAVAAAAVKRLHVDYKL